MLGLRGADYCRVPPDYPWRPRHHAQKMAWTETGAPTRTKTAHLGQEADLGWLAKPRFIWGSQTGLVSPTRERRSVAIAGVVWRWSGLWNHMIQGHLADTRTTQRMIIARDGVRGFPLALRRPTRSTIIYDSALVQT